MLFGVFADLLVVIHLAFILFVVLGGLLVIRWPRLAFVHLPAAFWVRSSSLETGFAP